MNILQSKYQSKDWRKSQDWYINGKHNECEKYQINIIENIINNKLNKTNYRFNIMTNQLENINNPLKLINGFEYTKNFDGIYDNKLFNLKFVCDNGGSQTRTLREVYHFISNQISYLNNNNKSLIFINILDGDNSFKNIDKFIYLKDKYLKKEYINDLYIGDLYSFNEYYKSK